MKPGYVLDPETGLPRVVPVRTTDGLLVFAYETRRTGGMSVLVDVPSEALAGRRDGETSDQADMNALLAEAASVAASKIAAGEGDADHDVARYAVGSAPAQPDAEAEAKLAEAERLAAEAAGRVEAAEDEISQRDVAIEELERKLAEAEARATAKAPARRKAPAKAAA